MIFDRGIPGGRDRNLSGGGVEVVFAADPAQADDLIRRLRAQAQGVDVGEQRRRAAAGSRGARRGELRGDEFVARFTLRAPESQEAGPKTMCN